jgi:hypothetical protein
MNITAFQLEELDVIALPTDEQHEGYMSKRKRIHKAWKQGKIESEHSILFQ